MGVRRAIQSDMSEELDRVKRHIDHAIFELTEARERMDAKSSLRRSIPSVPSRDLANLCISLELALADSVSSAQRLAEKIRDDAPCRALA